MPSTGTVETAGAPFWRILLQYRPDVRIVTVRRSVDAVLDSLGRLLTFDVEVMRKMLVKIDRKLDQLEARIPGVRRFEYDDLAREETCARLFETCLPYAHDHGWWAAHADLNIQVHLVAELRHYIAHKSQIDKLGEIAKQRMLAGMQRAPEIDGVSFQLEKMAPFIEDAAPLLREHMVQADYGPNDWEHFNHPAWRRLEELGALQITTARSNGRMFGYLVTVIGPALDAEERLVGMHTIYFASPLIRNLGIGLQRAANDFLRQRGVHEVQMRAGVRGSGPRLGTFYRRLGAEPHGQLYRLEL